MNFMQRLFSLVLIILLSPLLLVVSVLIKLESDGDVLFKQIRVGKDGKEFYIYKFRSMKIDTPELPSNDLYSPEMFVTRVGKILRITSLDELPQLFNILKGEMNFIGYRPVIKDEYELNNLREENNVFSIKPGITGWAQVNGRDELDNFTKVKLDKYYVDNKSLLLDFQILFLTFYKVIKKDGIREVSIYNEISDEKSLSQID